MNLVDLERPIRFFKEEIVPRYREAGQAQNFNRFDRLASYLGMLNKQQQDSIAHYLVSDFVIKPGEENLLEDIRATSLAWLIRGSSTETQKLVLGLAEKVLPENNYAAASTWWFLTLRQIEQQTLPRDQSQRIQAIYKIIKAKVFKPEDVQEDIGVVDSVVARFPYAQKYFDLEGLKRILQNS